MKDILFGKTSKSFSKKTIEFVDVLNSPNSNYILFTNIYNVPNKYHIEIINVDYSDTGNYINYAEVERTPFSKYIAFVDIISDFKYNQIMKFDIVKISESIAFELSKVYYDALLISDTHSISFNKQRDDKINNIDYGQVFHYNYTIGNYFSEMYVGNLLTF